MDETINLPCMAEVFEALRRGKHVSLSDGEIYHALKGNEAAYDRLFTNLGFKLVRHARDFYYFLDAANFTDLSTKMALFMFILVEHLADQGDAVEDTVMTRRFAYKDLPHLQGERHNAYMREAGVFTAEELAAIVRVMERFGFARRTDAESFSFDTPVYRFMDLCMEMAHRDAQAADEPAEEKPVGESEP